MKTLFKKIVENILEEGFTPNQRTQFLEELNKLSGIQIFDNDIKDSKQIINLAEEAFNKKWDGYCSEAKLLASAQANKIKEEVIEKLVDNYEEQEWLWKDQESEPVGKCLALLKESEHEEHFLGEMIASFKTTFNKQNPAKLELGDNIENIDALEEAVLDVIKTKRDAYSARLDAQDAAQNIYDDVFRVIDLKTTQEALEILKDEVDSTVRNSMLDIEQNTFDDESFYYRLQSLLGNDTFAMKHVQDADFTTLKFTDADNIEKKQDKNCCIGG